MGVAPSRGVGGSVRLLVRGLGKGGFYQGVVSSCETPRLFNHRFYFISLRSLPLIAIVCGNVRTYIFCPMYFIRVY